MLESATDALRARADALDAEQSTRGIDWLEELAIHPILQGGFRGAGFGVHPEQRYPSGATAPKQSEGERCDIVLTPDDSRPLADPLLAGTLFAKAGVAPDSALWIEVKTVGQFHVTDDAPRPNPAYTSDLTTAVFTDIRKLAREPGIVHAAALLVAFVQDRSIAEHDLGVWRERSLEKGLPVSVPLVSGFEITERIGNAWCAVALAQVHHL